MRKLSLSVVALAGLTVGCTSTGSQSSGGFTSLGGFASKQQEPTALAQAMGDQQPAEIQTVSFTEKVTTALTTNPFASKTPAKQPIDPIALGYNSGPPTPDLFVSMAQMADRGGNAPQARQLYERALSLQNNNLEALLGIARLEDREGRLDVALQVYQQAAAAHPNNPTALNDLGLCYARRGDLQTSLRILDQCVRLDPKKALYRNNIAKVLIEMNMTDHALGHLAAVNPPAVAQYNLGYLLNERGRKAEAAQHLTIAANLDPKMQPARDLLASHNGTQPAQNQSAATPPTGQPNGYQQPPAQVAHLNQRTYSVPAGQQPGQGVPPQAAGQPYYGQPVAPQQSVPGVYSPAPVGQQPIRR